MKSTTKQDEDRKLVRDLIPMIAESCESNTNVFGVYETEEEFRIGLCDKILEESQEVIEALLYTDDFEEILPILEEMCDLMEVIDCCSEMWLDPIDNTEDILNIISIDTPSVLARYDHLMHKDFALLLYSIRFSLYYSFRESDRDIFEQQCILLCGVILGYMSIYGIGVDEIKELQTEKREKRGGFEKACFLEL